MRRASTERASSWRWRTMSARICSAERVPGAGGDVAAVARAAELGGRGSVHQLISSLSLSKVALISFASSIAMSGVGGAAS